MAKKPAFEVQTHTNPDGSHVSYKVFRPHYSSKFFIDETATIGGGLELHVSYDRYITVHRNVVIGNNVKLYDCEAMEGCRIGDDCEIRGGSEQRAYGVGSRAVVGDRCKVYGLVGFNSHVKTVLGNDCRVHGYVHGIVGDRCTVRMDAGDFERIFIHNDCVVDIPERENRLFEPLPSLEILAYSDVYLDFVDKDVVIGTCAKVGWHKGETVARCDLQGLFIPDHARVGKACRLDETSYVMRLGKYTFVTDAEGQFEVFGDSPVSDHLPHDMDLMREMMTLAQLRDQMRVIALRNAEGRLQKLRQKAGNFFKEIEHDLKAVVE